MSLLFSSHITTSSPVRSFTCPVLHQQRAGPFLDTHRSCKGGPLLSQSIVGARRRAWTHQPRIRLLLLGRSQVRAAPHDFKGPCQCVLVKMRRGTSATQQSVIGRGHAAPSGRHHVVLAGEGVKQVRQNTRAQELRYLQDRGAGRHTGDGLGGGLR